MSDTEKLLKAAEKIIENQKKLQKQNAAIIRKLENLQTIQSEAHKIYIAPQGDNEDV